ncbi:hypothetical protein MYX75_07000 [Acidobacteria bacterium AH-259-A15]|nr:hypothetical protein [Acidobacteria bacterium AH-259-A15]
MTNKVDAALERLASFTQTLNEASDKLSVQIAAIESALSEYKLGITAWVNLKREQDFSEADDKGVRHQLTYVEQLGYGKHKGRWGLLVSWFWEELLDPYNLDQSFLRDTSRETRLAAIEKLPDLLEALAQKAAKVTEETTKKAAQAKEIAAALKQKAC